MSHTRWAIRRSVVNRCLIAVFATVAAMLWTDHPAHGQCEAGQLTHPDPKAEDGFAGVSVDGDVAVVGDRFAFDLLGAAYVYRRGPDGLADWRFEAVLTSPAPDPEEGFGGGVVSGDVIVVGVEGANAPDFQSGAVYIFRYDRGGSGQWKYEATLTASDGDTGDIFGWSVSVDGNVLLVGARDDENDGVPQSGSAYVFRYNPQTKEWNEEAKLTDPNGEELDLFGQAVSIKGDVALVGAHANHDAGLQTGAAFVFRYDRQGAGAWVFQQQLNAFDAEGQPWFGWSVKLSDDVALITAPQDNSQTGSAYVFRDTGKQWVHEIKLTAADPVGPFPHFGWSSSISGDTIILGAPQDFGLGVEAGAAHLFREKRRGWEEVIKLTASDGQAGDFFGASVAVSGDVAFISAPDQNAPGTVYIFDLDPTPGDLDCNGGVGAADLLALLVSWGPCDDCEDCAADLNGDCIVGVSDLLILLANWG